MMVKGRRWEAEGRRINQRSTSAFCLLPFAFAALIQARIEPPSPRVGDLITVDFSVAVVLDKSSDYEVVSHGGKRVVVRTFAPKPFVIAGTAGGERFHTSVPVASVLAPNDSMKPAPLTRPRAIPYPRAPFVAIAIAALAAIAAWVAVWLRARKPVEVVVPQLTPDERFRRAVLALRRHASHPRRWAALADETRAFLAATRAELGSELTTSELLPRLRQEERVIEDILRQGDLEKFSPWGASAEDFDAITERVMRIAS